MTKCTIISCIHLNSLMLLKGVAIASQNPMHCFFVLLEGHLQPISNVFFIYMPYVEAMPNLFLLSQPSMRQLMLGLVHNNRITT